MSKSTQTARLTETTSRAVRAIFAQAIAPGLADRYLARFGYGAQQRPERDIPGREDNLFGPTQGDR